MDRVYQAAAGLLKRKGPRSETAETEVKWESGAVDCGRKNVKPATARIAQLNIFLKHPWVVLTLSALAFAVSVLPAVPDLISFTAARWLIGIIAVALIYVAILTFSGWKRVGLPVVIVFLWWWSFAHMETVRLKLLEESLLPGLEVTPLSRCKINPDDVVLFLGNNNVSLTRLFPHTVLQVRDQKMIEVDREKGTGGLFISLLVLDQNGDVIAKMDHNRFLVNRNRAFRIERRSRSHLAVFDNKDFRVLDITFLNERTVRIYAVLFHPAFGKIVLSDQGLMSPRDGLMQDNCFMPLGAEAASLTFR